MTTLVILSAIVLAQTPTPSPSPSPEAQQSEAPAIAASPTPVDVKALFPEAPPPESATPAAELLAPKATVANGLPFGSAALQPSIVFSMIRGDIFPNTIADRPVKVRETYFQVEPRLGLELPFAVGGGLRAAYEPAFRTGSDLAQVERPTHRLGGSLELPVGPNASVRVGDQWARGILDVTQVDPGQEYFFDLARYTHNVFDVNGRVQGSDTDVDAGLTLDRVSIAPTSGFFSHRSRSLYGGLGRNIAATLHLRLGYTNERVPRLEERPEAESRSNIYSLTLDGAMAPLTDGQIMVGYRDQKAPNAGAGGQRFKGVVVAGRVEKELTRASRLAVWGSRDTRVDLLRRGALYPSTQGQPELGLPTLSAFEQNAFYVAKAVNAELQFPLPLQLAGRAGVQWQGNEYRTVATAIGRPRQDDFFGWSLGLGRPLTRHAWIRADYRRDRRNSNIDRFDVNTEALLFQVGIGYQGSRGRPTFFGTEER